MLYTKLKPGNLWSTRRHINLKQTRPYKINIQSPTEPTTEMLYAIPLLDNEDNDASQTQPRLPFNNGPKRPRTNHSTKAKDEAIKPVGSTTAVQQADDAYPLGAHRMWPNQMEKHHAPHTRLNAFFFGPSTHQVQQLRKLT